MDILASMPASRLRAVTPAATALPNGVCRALLVTADGAVEVIAENDTSAVSLGTWAAGSVIPVRARVVTTNTAATVVAIY